MNRKFILITVVFCSMILIPFSKVFTNATQPPAGRTGCTAGTDETTCGVSGCHNNTPNSGAGSLSVTFSDPNLKYTPGQIYDMTVTTSEAGMSKFGFEITSVDANGDSVGTLIIPNGTTNISSPTAGTINHRKYLGHKTASANNTWSFEWKAPAIDKGQLCFFAASNCANGNGSSSGDHIYTRSLCITPDSANGIFSPETSEHSFSILRMESNQLTLQYNQQANDHVNIEMYDLQGRIVQILLDENEPKGLQQHSFILTHSLVSGLYLIHYSSGNTSESKKIFIQK